MALRGTAELAGHADEYVSRWATAPSSIGSTLSRLKNAEEDFHGRKIELVVDSKSLMGSGQSSWSNRCRKLQ
jgi:hypothetical protein